MNYNYVVVEGNIGAGKTSLVKLFGEDLRAKLILERFAENSFLARFYSDQEKYAFPLELSFLAERFEQNRDEVQNRDIASGLIIADYYCAKSLIFASLTLKDEEFQLYRKLYTIIHRDIPIPGLLVYLHVPVAKLMQNIVKRGRDYERSITESYLLKIQKGYLDYLETVKNMRILIIEPGNLNYINVQDEYINLRNIILNTQYPMGINHIIL